MKVKVGIIGLGGIGQIHLEKFKAFPEKVQIVAVSDVVPSLVGDTAKKYGAEGYGDSDKLLDRKDVDAVSICVPNYLHAQVAVAAAEAGKHILLEKPIAVTLNEADAIISAVEKSGVKLMLGFNQLFNPMIIQTKKLIEAGRLGKISLVKTQYVRNLSGFSREKFGWRANVKQVGGGVLTESGAHRISLSRFLGGDVERVSAFTKRLVMDIDAEDTAVVLLDYKRGGLGTVICSWAAEFRGPEWEKIEVYGTEGSVIGYGDTRQGLAHLEFSNVNIPEYGRIHSYFPPSNIFTGGFDSYKNEIEHFLDCITTDTDPIATGYDGKAILEITLAAYKSAEMQKAISIPLQ